MPPTPSPAPTSIDAAFLRDLLQRRRFRFGSEADLQAGIAQALEREGVIFEREVALVATDRVDFMVGAVALEVKIHQSTNEVLRQLARYVSHDRVGEILLVTSRMRHQQMPEALSGKRLTVCVLMQSLL